MICASSHASTYAAERNISDKIDALNNCIIAFKVDADIETRCAYGKKLEAVVAPNQTYVVLVQPKIIMLHNHAL
jgi:hypothetical protein